MNTPFDQRGISRREFLGVAASAASMLVSGPEVEGSAASGFRLNYLLASAMYGTMPLDVILPEVKKTASLAIDIWPAPHGNQREQVHEMGPERFSEKLREQGVKLGCWTCYRPGPFQLKAEMEFVHEVAGEGVVLVTGAGGKVKGESTPAGIKSAIRAFFEKMKPQLDVAEKTGCVIAVENHANDLLETPDAIRWFGEMVPSARIGVAVAPHHLPQDSALIAGILRDLGPAVKFFYAQQHGKGSKDKLPKEEELLQMPGRGALDFGPLLAALQAIEFRGYTEIFMHPVPRGIPILETAAAVTDEINKSRNYLENCLAKS